MIYLWLKALHTAAVLVWVGGLFTQAALLAALARPGVDPSSRPLIPSMRRWDTHVTLPALILVWVLGIALGALSGSFSKSWLSTKLVFVVILSALHGMQAGMLRRYSANPDFRIPGFVRWFPGLIVVSVVAIAILVTVKPG
ncbi:CopD family protein [Verrucomicrobium sp. 3C]|uniref:CopD family protein n=1 Tax=Verrucomicrobium sp. 3C TaxID=1134055 RepID=UPI000372343D|nr:CopD family protein [Verrucomicrobium sp. 3C]